MPTTHCGGEPAGAGQSSAYRISERPDGFTIKLVKCPRVKVIPLNAFGTCDAGLLKYRHMEFSADDLDDIERLIHGLDEHPFRIPGKLAAIRAARLAAGGN